MRVFVTGATGHIGSALIPELLQAGHQVTGLARSDRAAARLADAGVGVVRGELADLDVVREAVQATDAVVHLAFPNEIMRGSGLPAAASADLGVIQAIGEALKGTGKTFIGVQGMLILAGLGRVGTEQDTVAGGPRVDAENYLIGLADHGVDASVVRFSPIIHSPELGKAGFASMLIQAALRTHVSAYVGDGENRWSAAGTRDTARLLRLALDEAPAGTRLHAVAEEGVTIKAIATAIGNHLDIPVTSIPAQEAPAHFGFLAQMIQLDAPASSEATRRLLDWSPRDPGILTDLDDQRLYDAAAAQTA